MFRVIYKQIIKQMPPGILLTAVKEESHGNEASESVAHLLPTSSHYIATEHSFTKGEPQSVWV